MKTVIRNICIFLTSKESLLFAMCVINLLYMHYTILATGKMEFIIDPQSYTDNLWASIFDSLILLSVLFIISAKRLELSLFLTFLITLLWSFCNLIYFRFFSNYISLSSISQIGAIKEGFIINTIIEKMSWKDIYYIMSCILFFIIIYSPIKHCKHFIKFYYYLAIIGLFFCIGIRASQFTSCIRFYFPTVYNLYFSNSLYSSSPLVTTFRRGAIRILAAECLNKFKGPIQLTNLQIDEINKCRHASNMTLCNTKNKKFDNMIFILVESYMSFTTDLTIEGKEVTPFLNALKKDSANYYNGKMKPNISIGESSDGQFIYMTGILPLRTQITVGQIQETFLPGIPCQLKKNVSESRIIIPTGPYLWEQRKMSDLYGFNKLYSSNDFLNGKYPTLNDEQVFMLAKQADRKSLKPFFSLILTMSMHYPYKKEIDPTFRITDKNITDDLRYYLNACHYTDRIIGDYIQHLKRIGQYENSLIVITSDHHVHTADFGNDIDTYIPVFIINGNIDSQTGWKDECNQIDIYTTILDLWGIQSNWNGLGQSLLNTSISKKTISRETREISEWLILSDFFGDKMRLFSGNNSK